MFKLFASKKQSNEIKMVDWFEEMKGNFPTGKVFIIIVRPSKPHRKHHLIEIPWDEKRFGVSDVYIFPNDVTDEIWALYRDHWKCSDCGFEYIFQEPGPV